MIDGLEDVRHIVSHKNCPDGIASALICHDALPDASVGFVMYGEDSYVNLRCIPGMLFVDIVPPAARAQEFADAGAIVLDHHKHAQDTVALFGERGRFADEETEPGVSGALLAYRHVNGPLYHARNAITAAMLAREDRLHNFAQLTGVRDTWQTNDPRWEDACAQAEALLLFGYDGLAPSVWLSTDQMNTGRALLMRKRASARSAAERAHVVDGFAFTNERYVSDFAEALRQSDSPAKVAVGFMYIGQDDGSISLVFSMRTIRGDTDVGAIAKANGGGGHTRAAGFKIDVWQDQDPVALFMTTVCA